MKNDATTTLGNVTFTFDGYMGKALINDKVIYEVSADEIDAYNAYAETAPEHLIAMIEMFIKDGGKLNEFQTTKFTRLSRARSN
jgi:hypothetical protein